MLSRFRLSPAMVVALIALFVSLSGAGYAITKIGTRNIKNGAVTAKKLHRKAVITSKIKDGAVTGNKIANGVINDAKVDGSIVTASTPGVAIAGVNIAENGTVRRFFNRYSSGGPTVSHPQAGTYQITFPGLEEKVISKTSISLATLVSGIGEIRVTSSGRNSVIRTANSAGAPKNLAFQFVIFLQSP